MFSGSDEFAPLRLHRVQVFAQPGGVGRPHHPEHRVLAQPDGNLPIQGVLGQGIDLSLIFYFPLQVPI